MISMIDKEKSCFGRIYSYCFCFFLGSSLHVITTVIYSPLELVYLNIKKCREWQRLIIHMSHSYVQENSYTIQSILEMINIG